MLSRSEAFEGKIDEFVRLGSILTDFVSPLMMATE